MMESMVEAFGRHGRHGKGIWKAWEVRVRYGRYGESRRIHRIPKRGFASVSHGD